MKIGIVGGGVLGLTLAHRLSVQGHDIELFEAGPELGGLAAAHDYGPFWWDRFYHCILPTDQHLIGLLRELGLGDELRWTPTGTGYYAAGRAHSMSNNADFLRFPLLSLIDKARLGATLLYATRFADPWRLYQVTAADWLTRTCGRRGYEVFWRPLLRAKFGPFHDQVAAVFIWATLTRLFGARSAATSQEKMGYCRGGYRRILGRLAETMRGRGVRLHVGAPVSAIRAEDAGAAIEYTEAGTPQRTRFDQVLFTAPTRLARKVVDDRLMPQVESVERDHPTSQAYLGVACLVLALRRPLSPYYVLNIGDENVELTGLIEMTNLIDRTQETAGLSLLYLPRYLDSGDSRLEKPDDELAAGMMDRGLLRLYPDLKPADIVYRGVHRARFVQPLPLVRTGQVNRPRLPTLERPFQILNTAMLTCATLNNNEVVGMVDRFVEHNRVALARGGHAPGR